MALSISYPQAGGNVGGFRVHEVLKVPPPFPPAPHKDPQRGEGLPSFDLPGHPIFYNKIAEPSPNQKTLSIWDPQSVDTVMWLGSQDRIRDALTVVLGNPQGEKDREDLEKAGIWFHRLSSIGEVKQKKLVVWISRVLKERASSEGDVPTARALVDEARLSLLTGEIEFLLGLEGGVLLALSRENMTRGLVRHIGHQTAFPGQILPGFDQETYAKYRELLETTGVTKSTVVSETDLAQLRMEILGGLWGSIVKLPDRAQIDYIDFLRNRPW